MRIRGMDEEGEALDELSNVKGDVYELTNGKVSIMKDENTYRSIYDILKDIAGVWDDITDKTKPNYLKNYLQKQEQIQVLLFFKTGIRLKKPLKQWKTVLEVLITK